MAPWAWSLRLSSEHSEEVHPDDAAEHVDKIQPECQRALNAAIPLVTRPAEMVRIVFDKEVPSSLVRDANSLRCVI